MNLGFNVIETPTGRRYRGRWPAQMPSTGEGPYIAALARQVRGACEVVLPLGRADVATATNVFEVEPARSWRTGCRQVLAYAGQTGLRPAVALFGQADYERIYLHLRDRLGTRVELGIELWIWRGHWEQITNRPAARRRWPEPIPPPDPASA